MGRDSTFCELEDILLGWYLDVQAPCIPVDGNIFCEKAKRVAVRMQIILLHRMDESVGLKIIVA